jgi:DNA-binding IscR family transcriptional regulator
MLSNKYKYAIRAVLYLASQDSETKMTNGTEIALLIFK